MKPYTGNRVTDGSQHLFADYEADGRTAATLYCSIRSDLMDIFASVGRWFCHQGKEAPMIKKYRVTLEAAEREQLRQLLSKGKADVRRLKHAQILLATDVSEGRPKQTDQQVAQSLHVGTATVERVRRRFVEQGLDSALSPYRTGHRVYKTKLDGAQEAHLIAIACSSPPEGHSRWTPPGVTLLADRMVELKHVDSVSRETVRQTLKKRTQASPEKDVVHPTQAVGGVRLPHGRRAGRLHAAVRSKAAGGLYG